MSCLPLSAISSLSVKRKQVNSECLIERNAMIIHDLESKSSDILMVSLFYSYMEDMNVWSLYVVSVSYRLSKAKNEEKEELAKPKHADYKSTASLSSFNDRGVVKRV